MNCGKLEKFQSVRQANSQRDDEDLEVFRIAFVLKQPEDGYRSVCRKAGITETTSDKTQAVRWSASVGDERLRQIKKRTKKLKKQLADLSLCPMLQDVICRKLQSLPRRWQLVDGSVTNGAHARWLKIDLLPQNEVSLNWNFPFR